LDVCDGISKIFSFQIWALPQFAEKQFLPFQNFVAAKILTRLHELICCAAKCEFENYTGKVK
jgi:hypothetical protein